MKKHSNRFLVDTSYVFALANKHDQDQDRAMELAKRCEGTQVVITEAVILEIGNSLARRFKEQALSLIDQFYDSDDVTIVPLSSEILRRAIELYRAYSDKSWGLVDCVSFIVMRDFGITDALTNDSDFHQAGFNALMLD